MHTKRVFMLSSQVLFSRGVERLLSGQTGVDVVGRESDPAAALERILALKPDVVILDSKDPASAPSGTVASILKELPHIKVIALNLADDRIYVYQGEQRSAECVDDLLGVIGEEAASTAAIEAHEWQSLAEGRAQVYAFLALAYTRPLDEALLDHLSTRPVQFISSLERDNDLTGDLSAGSQALARFQEALKSHPRVAARAALAAEYARLITPCAPGTPPSQACESAYASAEAVAGLEALYAEAEFSPPAPARRPPDCIACELAFMQQMCAGEHAAWTSHDHRGVSRYQRLERAALREHLARWVPRFCDALQAQATLDFYRGIACLTRGFILNEAYRVVDLME